MYVKILNLDFKLPSMKIHVLKEYLEPYDLVWCNSSELLANFELGSQFCEDYEDLSSKFMLKYIMKGHGHIRFLRDPFLATGFY